MSYDSTDLAELWMPTTCRTAFPTRRLRLRFTGQPEIVTTPRRSWRDNMEARVRYAIREMMPHDQLTIEGVTVTRDTMTPEHGCDLYYWIAGRRYKDFEAAVRAVIAAAGRRE